MSGCLLLKSLYHVLPFESKLSFTILRRSTLVRPNPLRAISFSHTTISSSSMEHRVWLKLHLTASSKLVMQGRPGDAVCPSNSALRCPRSFASLQGKLQIFL
ncbi:hypothetical protein PoB_003767200 [Plakobranchus ocellatus]|uniref:Uncharacterized protein n=1 Tax=Plakobranchus ocellatus TaxID=259542 RepID=A0AAV4AV34_9GAST|nr:hypothetical protein PoB_003767200 [Plakobranchus ocellatus]